MIFRTVMRIIWTAAAVMGYLSLAQETMATWILVSATCCIAIAWAIVMWKMDYVASAGQAIVWLLLILNIAFGFVMTILIGGKMESNWVVVPFFLVVLVVWITVLRFKVSLKWPLMIAGVLAVLCGVPILGIVSLIGIGKLVIECIGRRNILASSRIAARSVSISPRGLVGQESLSNRGFGLVGLMVGIVILLIALTMAASSFYSASRLTKQAASFTRASNLAEEVVEQIRLQPYASIHTREIKTGIPKLPDARCMANVKERESGLKEVTVTLSWLEDTRSREVRFSTLIAKGRTK